MDISKILPKATGNSFGRHITTGSDINLFLTELSNDTNLLGITCTGKTDGGGAQVLAVMSALAYSESTGVSYFHTPFKEVRFGDGYPDWHGRWERFFNLGHGETTTPTEALVLDASQYIEAGRPHGVIVSLPHCHNFIHRDGTADAYTATVRDKFRKKYYSGTPKNQHLGRYIAVHIRRGDVSADQHASRFASSDKVLENLRLYRTRTKSDLPLEVFSQGDASEFNFLPPREVSCLHLDVDVFETINRMVHGHGLVMGRSSFSYVAALLSQAEVMTDLWYHRPLSSWLVPTGNGNILPWGTISKYKRQIRSLQSRLATNPESVISKIEGDRELLKELRSARWCLALAYLREKPEKAEPILRELAAGKSGVANSARRTLVNRYSDIKATD